MTGITATFFKQHDKRGATDAAYAKKTARRRLRAQRKLDNMNREWKREVIDKQMGDTYRSRMAGPVISPPTCASKVDDGTEPEVVGGVVGVTRPFCKACQSYGHKRRTSKLCPKNSKSKYYNGTYV
jgi:hypothetical protein